MTLTKPISPGSVVYVGSAHVRFHQSLHFRPRQIENHRFLYVEEGCGEFLFASETLPIDGHTLLMLAPGPREIHYGSTEPVSYTYVEFESRSKLTEKPYVSYPETSPHFQTLVCLLRSIVFNKGAGADVLISAAIELTQLHPAHPRSVPELDACWITLTFISTVLFEWPSLPVKPIFPSRNFAESFATRCLLA
ncbi:MAG: hypothetical protein ACKVII_04240 [Planctomycetales bacterium]